jgi:hypothetical protein
MVILKPWALCESFETLTAFDLLPSNEDVKVILLDEKNLCRPLFTFTFL